jgi:pilus assembly protein CpaC
MFHRILLSASIGAAAIATAPLAAQTAPQQTARELMLTVGKSLIVDSAAPIERIAVGYGDVAEARAVGPRQLLLDAKAPGETSLIVWQQGGNTRFFDVIVRPNTTVSKARLDNLRRQIAQELPGQAIDVSYENDTYFLRGSARDMTSAQRATAIAGTAGKVANLLYVDVPPSETQILLKVQFATVDRNYTSDLGANIIATGAGNTIGRVTTGQYPAGGLQQIGAGVQTPFTISDALNIFLFRPDLNLGALIKALVTRNVAEILAEPNVLAINGKPASFLAGGEFPYPILQGGQGGIGTVTIAFRQFGVRIGFLPVITPRGTIRLDVAPEVSSLDYSAGLNVQGFTVPGLAMRRVETEIELQPGQSFAIGGLLDRRLTETIDKIPLLASIPVLGKIFQSKSLTKQNNELLVLVTPEIVKPLEAGNTPQVNFPYPLTGDKTGDKSMPQAPNSKASGPVAAERLPYEQLLQQLKTENDMKLLQTGGGGGAGADVSSWPGAQPLPMPGAVQPTGAAPAAPAAAPTGK